MYSYLMTNFTATEFEARMAVVMTGIKAMSDEYMTRRFPTLNKYTFTTMPGSRYIRIVRSDSFNVAAGGSVSRCVWGFVDKTNGDILKAAGWKAPAKHARGNIFDANPLANCNEYGPNYLR